jgi:pimeloyl-ACP methyl ester carboxylesterase
MSATDLVIVLPGITGSTLEKDGKPVWAPSAGAIINAIRTLGRNLKALELPSDIGDEDPGDGVRAVALMPDVHFIPGVWTPIRGYSTLLDMLERLRNRGDVGHVVPAPYDWRLSNRLNAQRLSRLIDEELGRWRDSDPSRAQAQVVFVCHSMGGLLARWYVEMCGGADVTRKIITLGTPYRGAAMAIDQLVNGVRKGLGPLQVDLTDFARSMPSLYQLLPEYACVESGQQLYKLDELTVPNLESAKLGNALEFHRALATAETNRPASLASTHAIVGVRQPTATTVRVVHGGVKMFATIGGDNDYGDGTVPLAGALRHDLAPDSNMIVRVPDNHGHLQANSFAFDQIESILTAKVIRYRALPAATARVSAPELVILGEPITVTVDLEMGSDARTPAVKVELEPDAASAARPAPDVRQPRLRDRTAVAVFEPTVPGAYRLRVSGVAPNTVTEVVNTVVVWGPQ